MYPVAVRHAYSSRGSRRSRLIGALLAFIVATLVILGLILSGFIPQIFVPMGARSLSTFDVRGGSEQRQPTKRPKQAAAKAAARQTPRPPSPTQPPPKPIVPMPVPKVPGMIVLSKEDYAGADIGKIKGTAPVAGTGDADATADSASTYGPGEGPGGKTLFAAEWYREPTRAELAFYMPKDSREGWGMIACRTIERNHVDNCRVLGESPGSGIGSGLRQAAWQFLVRPPRINGRPMIGAWVRIRFDLIRGLQK